ncbi:response regulator transcription factor [Petrocella sp. FN5]|uniref:response regulator transcription factor n=1 Tax=Petrocella sp. FN5 TaxID=3032002 RepID=UPI0023DA91BD|nr:response regulator transcription factor [Petrocella sp. FN5]MDF1616537.1 response regulator transcription factor [Petrocella sp. FN5]
MKEKILVVEDEVKIARFIELELKYEGYDVIVASDGRMGLEMFNEGGADLVLLDLMLPRLSGIEVCRRIRQANTNIPIIMLTAKDDVSDKVMGLDMGADDYMTKPFEIEELLARMRVALKRKDSPKENHVLKALTHKGLVVNELKREVMFKDEIIELTKKEYELLKYLLENKNIALDREKILEKVWGYDYYGDTNVIDVYVRYLRAKIDQKYNVEIIKTVRGIGYIINEA